MINFSIFKFCLCALAGFMTTESLTNVKTTSNQALTSTNENYTYVEDIVGYAPYTDGFSWNKVEEYKQKGYKHVDGNFNVDTGYDRSEVYLMYKTTDDENKALRKVSTMEMDGGYSSWDYSSIVEGYDPNIRHSIKEFKDATNYYAKHYNSKDLASVEAKKLLDFYFYPKTTKETTGEKLGSYLLTTRSDEDYKRILLYSNATIFGNIVNAILLSSVETGSNLWMNRFVEQLKNPICDILDTDNESEYTILKNNYGSTLDVISSNIKTYVTDLEAAKVRYSNNKIDDGEQFISVEDTIQKMIDRSTEQPPEGSEDALLIQYNALLSNYHVYNIGGNSVNKTLADIFNEMGQGDLESTYGYMYALINALNPAQLFGLKNAGLGSLMLYTSFSLPFTGANLTPDQKKIVDEYGSLSCVDAQIEKSREKFVSLLGTDCISIYEGTNSDLLDRRCAMSSEAIRNNAALNDLDKLMVDDTLQENLIKALTIVGYIAGICANIAMVSFSLGMMFFSNVGFIALMKMGIMAIRGIAVRTVKCVIGAAVGAGGVVGLIICVCVAVIIGIIILVKKLIDHFDDLQETYSPIPETIIDRTLVNGNSVYSRYDVVRNLMNDEPFDMNYKRVFKKSGVEKKYATRFQALYYTKDKRLGAPLIEKDGVFMAHSHSSQEITSSMYPVCKFGNYAPANLNAYKTKGDAPTSYAYYNTKGKVIDPTFKNGKYIESLILRCDKNSDVARNQVTNEGFTLLDKNLSPNNDYSTFIGYRTTDNSEQAVTDIRLAWNDTADCIYWGDLENTYGFAGSGLQDVSNKGENKNHVSLYYSKKRTVGTPILSHVNADETLTADGFGICNDASQIPEGYEGINFFSGGTAFDFNFYNKVKDGGWDSNERVFLYFKPEYQYTSKNSIPYVSGIGVLGGSMGPISGHSLNDYANEVGFLKDQIAGSNTKFDPIADNMNLCNGIGGLYLMASYTYNPYRAIYDIGVQTGQENSPYLPNNLVANEQGYVTSNIYCQADSVYYGTNTAFKNDKYRIIRDSHTIHNNNNGSLEEGKTGASNWIICPRALYCAGPSSNRSPIKANTIHCYDKLDSYPTSRAGWCSAHELKNHYYTETLNEVTKEKAYNFSSYRPNIDGDSAFYLFYESTIRERPRYVETVYTYESTAKKNSYNEVIFNLLYMGCDEIFEDYTISKLNKKGEDFSKQIYFHLSDKALWDNHHIFYGEWAKSGLSKHQDGTGFLGVKYTNKKSKAISGIKVYCQTVDEYTKSGSKNPSDVMNMPSDITGNEVSYTRATDKITCADNMYMWLYTTQTGNKITNLKLSSNLSINISDVQINSHQFTINSHIVTDQSLSNSRAKNFFLTYECEQAAYIKDLVYYYTTKGFFQLSLLAARQSGCTDFKVYEIQDGIYLVIALVRTTSRVEAIKDLRLTIDKNYNTKIGNNDYTLATKITSAFTFNGDIPLFISYTRGTESDNNYALTDIVFNLINGNNTTTSTATYEDLIPETCYDFGSSSSGGNFQISFLDGTFSVGMLRKDNKNIWGYQGPTGTSASIFVDNPSFAALLILIGIVAIGGGIAISVYYYERRKKHTNINK